MAAVYHVRIKKEYAAAVIEDLQKMDAIELFEPETNGEDDISEGQQEESLRRLEEMKKYPEHNVPLSEALDTLRSWAKLSILNYTCPIVLWQN